MKKIYWRPSKVPRTILVVVAILAIASISTVELIKVRKQQPYYREKIQAALAMKRGMDVIREYRVKNIGPVDTGPDPLNSGLIGLAQSPITSTLGHLPVKQTTVNPNWAAVMIQMYTEADLKAGDVVAMGFSGSFPALNLAALVAAKVLKLKPIVITSAAASTWGANIPAFTWLDMERVLYSEGVIPCRSAAASLGGKEDQALKLSKEGQRLLKEAVRRNGVRLLEGDLAEENVDRRMTVYHDIAGDRPVAAYVNVGGGTVSVGTVVGKKLFRPGLNLKAPAGALEVDGVMSRFAREAKPVVNMVYIEKVAEEYGLPKIPSEMPKVGEGGIYLQIKYNLYLAAANLVALVVILFVLLRSDIGYRIFGAPHASQTPKHPEPMV